jgi:hypothetical protein
VEAEEAGAMEVVQGLLRHLARGVGAVDPLAQGGHEGARPAHRLVVADAGEAARGAGRVAHARVPATWGIAE